MCKAVFIILIISSYLMTANCSSDGSTRIRIENVGDNALEDVVVYVTGRTYRLGEIGPYKMRAIDVSPTDESHVEIEHSSPTGEKQRLYVDCYLEPGSGGILEVRVTPDSVISVKRKKRIL